MSKELRSLVETFDLIAGDRRPAVLATVIDVRGSSYRLPGARMLIDSEGQTHGIVSGGCLEADLLLRARRVSDTAVAEVFVYDTSINDDSVFALNMGCRGVIRILLEPAFSALISFIRHRLSSRTGGVVATLVRNGLADDSRIAARLMIDERGLVASDFGADVEAVLAADCSTALENRQSRLAAYEFGEVFIEYINPPVPLVVFGAGYDAVPLIRFAKELGWRVTVIDHRPAAAARSEFSIADEFIIARPDEAAALVRIDHDSVAVVMTHNYALDLEIAAFLLRSSARYVGLLGPGSRAERLLRDLSNTGLNASANRERVYAPIGIDIGAETPEEIALSIIAEIRAVLAARPAGMLRERTGPIHGRLDNRESETSEIISSHARVNTNNSLA